MLLRKLLKIQPDLHPTNIMVDFEKAAINSFEEHFLTVTSGCFFHLCQNIYRKIQSEGLTGQYLLDMEFVQNLKMLPSLAFVPEEEVVDCFNTIMVDFPLSALNVAKYFEDTYIGKQIPNHSRRVPQFPIRIWNMYERVQGELARTNNVVEGWHNTFQTNLACFHPTISKFLLC